MPEQFKRQIAFRMPIASLLNSELQFEQEKFKNVLVKDKEVTRVNLIANVVDKFVSEQKPYISLTLDDGTANIRVKAFAENIELLKEIELGDTLTVIGVLRFYNNELYILPEIAKKLDAKWLLARKLELQEAGYNIDELKLNKEIDFKQREMQQESKWKESREEKATEETENEEIIPEKIEQSKEETEGKEKQASLNDKIFDKIRQATEQQGIDVEELIMSLNEPVDEINKAITRLLENGEIYEPRPGRLKIL